MLFLCDLESLPCHFSCSKPIKPLFFFKIVVHFCDTVPNFIFESWHSLQIRYSIIHLLFEINIILQLFLLSLPRIVTIRSKSSGPNSPLVHGLHAPMPWVIRGIRLPWADCWLDSGKGLVSFETVDHLREVVGTTVSVHHLGAEIIVVISVRACHCLSLDTVFLEG